MGNDRKPWVRKQHQHNMDLEMKTQLQNDNKQETARESIRVDAKKKPQVHMVAAQ